MSRNFKDNEDFKQVPEGGETQFLWRPEVPPGERGEDAARTEDAKYNKGDSEAGQEKAGIRLTEFRVTDKQGNQQGHNGHARGHADHPHGWNRRRGNPIELFIYRPHDRVGIGGGKQGEPETDQRQVQRDHPDGCGGAKKRKEKKAQRV